MLGRRKFADLRYLPTFVQRTAEMLERDRSHPSVVYWSVGNESTWGPDFETAHQFVKKHDPTRPASAGQSATLELATMHNPISLERMREREDVKVPILWDESMAPFQGDLWGDTREMWLDPGERDYYIAATDSDLGGRAGQQERAGQYHLGLGRRRIPGSRTRLGIWPRRHRYSRAHVSTAFIICPGAALSVTLPGESWMDGAARNRSSGT